MTREIGGGLTEPHSISQAGKVVKAPVAFRTAVLLFLIGTTTITKPIGGMTMNVTHCIHTFVKSILTNKEWTLRSQGEEKETRSVSAYIMHK